MSRKLTAKSSLENIKKEAKRWLRALRATDAQARERLHQAHPHASEPPSLRDVQHGLAVEHGVVDWIALKALLSDNTLAHRSHEERLADFLEHSCLHYGVRPDTTEWDPSYEDSPSRWRYAARILERNPDIARSSIHAAAVSGNLADVERMLAQQPTAARTKGGPQQWEPLLFVCFGRLPTPSASDNAMAIARTLLDAGAEADVALHATNIIFRPLVGTIGGGEFAQPPHPLAASLAALLIERGADPYQPQALYNTSLDSDDVFLLDFLYSESERRHETHKWREAAVQWPQAGMLDYLLGNAVSGNRLKRALWLLEHGAHANSINHYSQRKVRTDALLRGYTAMANLLQRFAATIDTLEGHDAFQVACMQLDRETARTMSQRHPEYLLDPQPLLHAAEHDLLEVATLLLDLGMSPDVHNDKNHRPLHTAASHDSIRVGTLLIERGAEIDPRETAHNGVPLGWALYGQSQRMTDMLGRLSCDPWMLVRMGNVERLRELFATDPRMAQTMKDGSLLFYLSDEEDAALAVARFLLASGTDPAATNAAGETAADHAEKAGLDTVADLIATSTQV